MDNSGEKIKSIASVICVIGILIFVILGFVLLANGIGLKEYRETEQMGSILIWAGVFTAVIGSLITWIVSILFSGFGELICSQQRTEQNTAEILKKLNTLPFQIDEKGVQTKKASFDDLPNL